VLAACRHAEHPGTALTTAPACNQQAGATHTTITDDGIIDKINDG
jgi:hypothetical protein